MKQMCERKRYLHYSVKNPLQNASRFVISQARAACCVVFAVNSQLVTAKRCRAIIPIRLVISRQRYANDPENQVKRRV